MDDTEDINDVMEFLIPPEFLDVSIQTSDLIELAIDMWRLERRLAKALPLLPEEQKANINNSLQKLKRYLDKYNIEILDHTNQKYDEGQNLEVLAAEKDPNTKEPTIKETKEPTILYKGQVVHIGKVIIVNNE
jgi:hypothetical protein